MDFCILNSVQSVETTGLFRKASSLRDKRDQIFLIIYYMPNALLHHLTYFLP